MAAAVGVEAQRQPVPAKHFQQSPKRRIRAFLLDQEGRQNPARGVVQRHDQVERRLAAEPFVPRAVLMQHHARQRPARALASMRPAPLGALQQTARMKKRLRPRVAPVEAMMFHEPFMKMLGREARIPLAIKRLHFRLTTRRNPLGRDLAEPTVPQSRLALVLETLPPPPKRPFAHTQKLRRLQLTELRRLPTTQYVLELDHPHTLMGFRPPHPTPSKGPMRTGQIVCYLNRTYPVLARISQSPRCIGAATQR